VNTYLKSRFHRLFKNEFLHKFTTVLGVDILVRASGFILLPVFLRLMSQDEFGLYSYLISIIQTFSLVLNFGLYIPLSKLYHVRNLKESKGSLLYTIIFTLIIFILILSILILLLRLDVKAVSFLFDNHLQYEKFRGVIWLSLIISVFSFMLTNYLYTSEKIREVKAYNITRILGINIVTIVALFILKGNTVFIRLGFNYITEFILLIIFGRHLIKELKIHFSKRIMIKAIKMGLPIMLSAIFGLAINFSDKFLLQHYGSLKELSNYYLAFSFASIISLIFASLQNVWLPVFMKEMDVEVNFRRTKKLIARLLLFFTVLAVLIWLVFVVMISTRIIPGKYHDVIWVLPILLTAQIFVSISSLYSNYAIYFERTIVVSISGLIVSIISISLGLWLIPLWGIYGAGIVNLLVNLIYLLTYYYVVVHYKRKYTSSANLTII
jgi:O-antigen/teichoic acid export membrane protein